MPQDFVLFSGIETTDWVNDLMDICGPIRRQYPLAFHNPELYSDKDFYMMVGLTKPQFSSLVPYLTGDMRTSQARSIENALALFLMKLRHNIPQEV